MRNNHQSQMGNEYIKSGAEDNADGAAVRVQLVDVHRIKVVQHLAYQ